ncbi:MAG: glycosyltransferase, partial [Alphaproteobacteria bacterium]|nr:glycosyltransferase [Alphaproteobacteria bacterium]
PYAAEIWLLPIALALLVAPACIRLGAVATGVPPLPDPVRPPDELLPPYSVLIPLRNEAAMVPQLFAAMRALDYPPSALDIKFVVEAASVHTISAVEALPDDPRFSLVSVPDAAPRTKPKALDYALPLCTGEHVVVFDAEDIPDPDQLWKAALRFADTPDLVCLQAHLTIDNGGANALAALFAGEYAGLFGVLLPALARWRLPMPLGGTSNHFRTSVLRDLGGWDAFNVTEDADLGMRLARRRLRVATLQSCTREHAPQRLRPWLGQRTRWMKGWMQTFIVHNRNPGRLIDEMGLGPMLAFEVLVLGMIMAPLLHFGLCIGLLVHLVLNLPLLDSKGWSVLYIGILFLGYTSTLAMTALGLARRGQLPLLPAQILLPLYWLLLALATVNALIDLLRRPFYWFKSPHRPVSGQGTHGASPRDSGRTASH